MISFNEFCKMEEDKMFKRLMNDPLIKKMLKEVKKMSRPYFETEVVKIGKPKPKTFRCRACGTLLPAEKPKGNWVNGENLDAIKFPCFCSYKDNDYPHRCYGMLIKNQGDYKIIPLKQQDKVLHYPFSEGLFYFIENWDIHILKGKIILYEEEK